MSGYPSTDTLPDDDACMFIAKPFTPDSLAQKVFEMLEQARSDQVPTGNRTLP